MVFRRHLSQSLAIATLVASFASLASLAWGQNPSPSSASTPVAAPAAEAAKPAVEAAKPAAARPKHPTYQELMKAPDPALKDWDKLKLTDSEGKEISIESFRGKLVLINFFFTHCPSICPPQTAGLVQTWKKLDSKAKKDVVFLSLSIDPAQDDVAKLAEYKKAFKIEDRDWVFARTNPENVKKLGAYFGSLSGGSDPLEHKGRIYLVDPKGLFLLSYASAPLVDSDRIAKDLAGAHSAFIKKRS